MVKPEQIPDEVVKAFYRAYWIEDTSDAEALAAALAAWPGAWGHEQEDACGVRRELILPLPPEGDA